MKTTTKYNHLLTEAVEFLTIAQTEYATGKKKNSDMDNVSQFIGWMQTKTK